MLALRYAALLAIVVWLGGLIVLGGVAAPAIFDVTGMHAAGGRMLAGDIFGEVLRRFHHVSYVCGCVIPLTLLARGALGPRPRRFAMRVALSVLMLAAVLYSGFVVLPKVERLQASIGVAPSSLAEGDARRVEFGRLHAMSTGVQIIPLLGALMLLAYEMRD
jgi:hypothetical protein